MRIGPLTLESNLFLSPLAGYTNLPFRLVVRELGGVGLCTTDLVNARSLLENKPKAPRINLGMELIGEKRTVVDGDFGILRRVQFGAQYLF